VTKVRKEVRAFATFSPETGINPYWIRSHAKHIRGEPGSTENKVWKNAVKRGWRIVRVRVVLDHQ